MSDQIKRRDFLKYLTATGSVAWLAASNVLGETGLGGYTRPVPFTINPFDPHGPHELDRNLFEAHAACNSESVFSLSVASGDPREHGIVLWTRIDPQAFAGANTPVAYQIARHPSFKHDHLVVEGLAVVDPARDYTIKLPIECSGLRSWETYYYRFLYRGTASRTGRFKTLPREGASLGRVRFAFISCQDYTNGYYTALQHLANEELDFVIHLGDYIYESVSDPLFQTNQVRPLPLLPNGARLPSGGNSASSLDDYRYLYTIYRSDRNLQALHENFAVIQIWDDHEFHDDSFGTCFVGDTTPPPTCAGELRQAANRAWSEYSLANVAFDPARNPTESIRIYRSFRFGRLMELVATDERLYRDGPPCGFAFEQRYVTTRCPEAESTTRTMLGTTQREWFIDRVSNSEAIWKIWANEVTLMQFKLFNTLLLANPELIARLPPELQQLLASLPPELLVDRYFGLDQWDGYPAERAAILGALRQRGVKNLVAVTGDIHTFITGYLKENFDDLVAPPVGVEFVGSSVTSTTLAELVAAFAQGSQQIASAPMPAAALPGIPLELLAVPFILANNPHMAFLEPVSHGYCVMEITPASARCTIKTVSTVSQPQAELRSLISFIVPRDQALLVPTPPLT
ncbi:MAG TPA: alkaline phosphatase D family protein [Blastocatellia bacterium]|nr:alkaline phosphatase D family protein [Blastocatellia bacterium]